MEKSSESQERSQKKLYAASMSEITLRNVDRKSERRASMPIPAIRPLSDGIKRQASISTTMLRSSSGNRNSEVTIDEESRDELGQIINARPLSNTIQNPEESRDELGQTINARPLSNTIQNPELGQTINARPLSNTIQNPEESRDELGQTINARPLSNTIQNPELGQTINARPLSNTIQNPELGQTINTRPLSNTIQNPELGQAIKARPLSNEIRNQELGQATKARPLSNEIRNQESMPYTSRRRIELSGIIRSENGSSQNMNASMLKTTYESPNSANGKRGYVLVIINNEFGGKYSKLPDGTDDIKEIENLFSRPNYIVICLFNQNKNEILDTIKELASKEDSTRFICFLSSHGDNTSLVCPRNAYGEENVKIRDVLKCANTPQLKDCPKIFFIDACRTGKVEIMWSKDFPEPPGKGYYVGFSCLHQTTSEWPIGRKSCGLYFDALIKVFKDSFGRPAKETLKIRDLNDLMEKVHCHLGEQTRNGQPIQTPVCKSTLSGQVFLHAHE